MVFDWVFDVGAVLINAFSGSPEGTKKVAGGCGCQPLVRISLEPRLTGNRLKPVLLSRKGATAAAVARRVGILEDESLAHQRLFVFESGSVQKQKTFRVNEGARAEFLEDLVAAACLGVKAHGIRETGAATALHAYAQATLFGRNAILFEQLANFLRGALGEVDFRDVWACDFRCHFQLLQMPHGVNRAG